jgi:hypothetical protein
VITAWALEHVHHAFASVNAQRGRFVSIYGSPRDLSVAEILNKNVAPVTGFDLDIYRPLITTKDVSRMVPPARMAVPNHNYDGGLMVDIYANGTDALTPSSIFNTMRDFGLWRGRGMSHPLLWVGHDFNGPAGTVEGEGAWIRVDGQILDRPDIMSECYPAHDACDWIWEKDKVVLGDGNVLHWTIVKRLGDSVAVRFHVSDPDTGKDFLGAVHPKPVPEFKQLSVRLQTFGSVWEWVDWIPGLTGFSDVQTFLVPTALMTSLGLSPGITPESGMRVRLTEADVSPKLLANASVKVHSSLFPEVWERALPAIVCYLTRERTKASRPLLQILGFKQQNDVADMNTFFKGYGSQPKTYPWRNRLLILLVVILGAWLFRKYKLSRFLPALRRYSASVLLLWSTLMSRSTDTQLWVLKLVQWNMPLFNFLCCNWAKYPIVDGFIAPVLEESIKRCGFLPQVGLVATEGMLACALGESLPAVGLRMMAHCLLKETPFVKAVAIHGGWNFGVMLVNRWLGAEELPSATCSMNLFRQWVDYYHRSLWADRKLLPADVVVERFEPAEGMIPNEPVGFVQTIPEPDPLLLEHLRGKRWDGGPDRIVDHCTYWFLHFGVPTYRPAKTDANLLSVLDNRLLACAPGEASKDVNWDGLHYLINIFVKSCPLTYHDALVDDWVSHFHGRHRKRYEEVVREYHELGPAWVRKHAQQTDIMVKTDEVLIRVKNGQCEMKPRPIAVVNPRVTALLGPHIYAAQGALKEQWNVFGAVVPFKGVIFHMCFACGWTDRDLSDWAAYAMEWRAGHTWVLVSGDDSVVVEHTLAGSRFLEADASMCDQSQGFGALRFHRDLLVRLGVPSSVAGLVYGLTQNVYVLQGNTDPLRRLKLSRRDRPFRDTGGSDTCLGNSGYIGFAWVVRLTGLYTFPELGVDMKLNEHVDIRDCTFLKGMWYPTDQGLFWGPLPSRLLKVGKSWRDPRELYGTRSYGEAAYWFLQDMATSYSHYLAVPLLRAFVSRFAREELRRDVREGEWVSVEGAQGPKPRVMLDSWFWLERRYGLTHSDFLEMEAMIPATPFWFLSHPGFTVVGLRDYS